MEDLGFDGSGSQFVSSRFKAGDPVSAKQLNQLAASVQTALPQPYIGEGNQVSFTGGGSLILGNQSTLSRTLYPFTIYVTKVESAYKFTARPGTINGLVPCINGSTGSSKLLTATPTPTGDLSFDGDGNCWVYLRAGPKSGTSKYWPNDNITETSYPNVIASNVILSDTDDFGYILVALVTKNASTGIVATNQFLKTNVWSQRNKYTLPNSSVYYFWPI